MDLEIEEKKLKYNYILIHSKMRIVKTKAYNMHKLK